MKKIAFCFLIYDVINHEDLWNEFFQNIDKNKYNIYIHYKINTPLSYFEQFKLKHCISTQYEHISIVHAQNLLLQNALLDSDNQHFIFISNSCVPLKSFEHIYSSLSTQHSYFNICSQYKCLQRCSHLLNDSNKHFLQKSSQWCILNKKHASLMLSNTDYFDWFKDITAPDEHCYISNIFYHNLQDEIITTPDVAHDATTFTNWEGYDYPFPSLFQLKNYSSISENELRFLLESKCFFGRKFNQECNMHSHIILPTIRSS